MCTLCVVLVRFAGSSGSGASLRSSHVGLVRHVAQMFTTGVDTAFHDMRLAAGGSAVFPGPAAAAILRQADEPWELPLAGLPSRFQAGPGTLSVVLLLGGGSFPLPHQVQGAGYAPAPAFLCGRGSAAFNVSSGLAATDAALRAIVKDQSQPHLQLARSLCSLDTPLEVTPAAPTVQGTSTDVLDGLLALAVARRIRSRGGCGGGAPHSLCSVNGTPLEDFDVEGLFTRRPVAQRAPSGEQSGTARATVVPGTWQWHSAVRDAGPLLSRVGRSWQAEANTRVETVALLLAFSDAGDLSPACLAELQAGLAGMETRIGYASGCAVPGMGGGQDEHPAHAPVQGSTPGPARSDLQGAWRRAPHSLRLQTAVCAGLAEDAGLHALRQASEDTHGAFVPVVLPYLQALLHWGALRHGLGEVAAVAARVWPALAASSGGASPRAAFRRSLQHLTAWVPGLLPLLHAVLPLGMAGDVLPGHHPAPEASLRLPTAFRVFHLPGASTDAVWDSLQAAVASAPLHAVWLQVGRAGQVAGLGARAPGNLASSAPPAHVKELDAIAAATFVAAGDAIDITTAATAEYFRCAHPSAACPLAGLRSVASWAAETHSAPPSPVSRVLQCNDVDGARLPGGVSPAWPHAGAFAACCGRGGAADTAASFQCPGSVGGALQCHQLNDDWCDCAGCEDEPGTAAAGPHHTAPFHCLAGRAAAHDGALPLALNPAGSAWRLPSLHLASRRGGAGAPGQAQDGAPRGSDAVPRSAVQDGVCDCAGCEEEVEAPCPGCAPTVHFAEVDVHAVWRGPGRASRQGGGLLGWLGVGGG